MEVGGRRQQLGRKVNQGQIQLLHLSQQPVEAEDLEVSCPQIRMVVPVPVERIVNLAELLAKLFIRIGLNTETRVLLVVL